MSLPHDDKASTINLKDPVWFREWFKVIVREWSLELTMQQLSMVIFIFDRTAAWGKEWELIRYSSFVEGITSKDGSKRYAAGVCNSVSTATRITNELLALDMLVKRRSQAGNLWALNYNRSNNRMKPTRKIKRDQSPVTGSNQSPMNGSNQSPVTGYKNNYVKKGTVTQKITPRCLTAREDISITEALANATGKAKAARDRKAAKRGGKLGSLEVSHLWASSLKDADWVESSDLASGRLYLSKKESQALKSYGDRFNQNYPNDSFADFMKWVIQQWPGIREEVFGWMTKAPSPESPVALFIIKWADKIEAVYMKRQAFEKRLTKTPEEREVSRLIGRGMRVDEAKAKALGKPMYGKYLAGGREIKSPVDTIVAFKPKTKQFKNRANGKDPVALPTLKDESFADDYED